MQTFFLFFFFHSGICFPLSSSLSLSLSQKNLIPFFPYGRSISFDFGYSDGKFLESRGFEPVEGFYQLGLTLSNLGITNHKSALTVESFPVTQNLGDGVYSVSTCKQGAIEGVVIATGVHTLFEKAIHLVETTTIDGHL